jgi:hypothetical protein
MDLTINRPVESPLKEQKLKLIPSLKIDEATGNFEVPVAIEGVAPAAPKPAKGAPPDDPTAPPTNGGTPAPLQAFALGVQINKQEDPVQGTVLRVTVSNGGDRVGEFSVPMDSVLSAAGVPRP